MIQQQQRLHLNMIKLSQAYDLEIEISSRRKKQVNTEDLSIEYDFRQLSILNRGAVVVASSVRELKRDLSSVH